MLKITFITVCYNAIDTLEKTILSIINQTYPNIEYIIIDGASTDGTVDIIRKYEHKLTYWISEPDKGIYDAMNKGLKMATGDYVNFMNADDILLHIPYEELEFISNDNLYLGLCGCILAENDRIIKPYFNWRMKLRNGLPHQALFYKKKYITEYDTKWKIVSDYNLNLLLYKTRNKILLSEEIISIHYAGISGNKLSAQESFRVIYSQYGFLWVFFSWINRKICAIRSILN